MVLPIYTTLGEATDQLPNTYQTLPSFTIRSVGPTVWHIVPDRHLSQPFERWAMALYGNAKQSF